MADDMYTTMSIASAGVSTLGAGGGGGRGRAGRAAREVNRTGDIFGATPAPRHVPRRTGGTDFTLSTRDIAGAAPAVQHRKYGNKPDYALSTADIDGAHARKNNFQSQRHVDPLNPQYGWEAPAARSTTPPKFLRDTLRVDDIAGAAPLRHVRGAERKSMDVSDIAGASVRQSKARNYARSMDVGDILSDGKRRSHRVTDPLAPTHTIHGMVLSDDPLTKPRSKHRATNTPFYALATHDIEGAVPGWKPKHKMGGVAPEKRRHFRNTNFVADIPGTTAGSRARGLRSHRVTNPNAPSYTPLEGRQYRPPGASSAAAGGRATLANIGSASNTRGAPPARARAADPRDAEIAALRAQVATLDKRARVAEVTRRLPSRAAAADAAAVAALPDL